jgi:AraC-like DNA-binding protein
LRKYHSQLKARYIFAIIPLSGHMGVYRHIPAPPLNQFVELFWYYVDLIPDHAREHVLPDGTFELIINLQETPRKLFRRVGTDDHDAFKRGWVSGAQSKFLMIDALPYSSMIGVHFRPGGAAAFLGLPANELAGQVVELDAVWGNEVWAWRDQLLAGKTSAEKFAVLERLLLQRLAHSRPYRHRSVDWALERFAADPRVQTIASVSRDVGFSHKHFIDLFRRETGLTPKLFCRIRRFQQALIEIQARGELDWADIACSCGYFDQSHFIHDFAEFSGLKPSAYPKRCLEGERNFVRVA